MTATLIGFFSQENCLTKRETQTADKIRNEEIKQALSISQCMKTSLVNIVMYEKLNDKKNYLKKLRYKISEL